MLARRAGSHAAASAMPRSICSEAGSLAPGTGRKSMAFTHVNSVVLAFTSWPRKDSVPQRQKAYHLYRSDTKIDTQYGESATRQSGNALPLKHLRRPFRVHLAVPMLLA